MLDDSDLGMCACSPVALAATSGVDTPSATLSFAFAPDRNSTLPHISLVQVADGEPCVAEVSNATSGPWSNASLSIGPGNATVVVAAEAGPFVYVRYGAGPVPCAIVDNSTGMALPAPPFVLMISSSTPPLPTPVETHIAPPLASSKKASLIASTLLSSSHVIREDGSFDAEQYFRHGRERARAVAALQVHMLIVLLCPRRHIF